MSTPGLKKKEWVRACLAVTVFLVFFGSAMAAPSIMSLADIKPGMKGKGKSVFKESRVEEFDVEILGVIANPGLPKKNIILAKLSGSGLDHTGVISGMSGSPVYIGDKLIGAVAYSFPFSKDPIAGITPISEMLAIPERGQESSAPAPPRIPFQRSLAFEDLIELNRDLFLPPAPFVAEGKTLAPLHIPLVFNGFHSSAFEKTKPFFSGLGLLPVRSGGGSQSLDIVSPASLTLQPGDSVGVQLIGGDLSLAAVGTVTHVEGNRVLAFGHPLYNLGTVDYGMTKARIITVISSLQTSFKLSTSEALVGKFSQDRTSGVAGEIGRMPQFIPLNIRMTGSGGDKREFKIQVVNDRILSPLLTNLALYNILISEERSYGNLSLELEGNIYLDNGMNIRLEDFFSGNFDNPAVNLSGLLAAVIYFLTNNEFKDLGIHRMDLNIRSSEEARFSYLERVLLDKYEVSPGERIQIKLFTRTFRGESVLQELQIATPQLPSGSEFLLIIGDAASMHQVEMVQYRSQAFMPRSLNQLIRILNNLRKNNRVYFKVVASKPGLFLKGEELPNLPPTMKSLLASPRAGASAPTELTRSTLMEYQLPVPYVFKGMVTIPIKIR